MTPLFDINQMYLAVKDSTAEEINEMRAAFFAGLRLGLDTSDRMNYDETSDEVYKHIQKAEREMMDAMEILMKRTDLVARTRAYALAVE